jgi:hypothetical protein
MIVRAKKLMNNTAIIFRIQPKKSLLLTLIFGQFIFQFAYEMKTTKKTCP